MKRISKDTISKFSNKPRTMESMLEFMRSNPYMISGYIRSKAQYQNTLMNIIEGVGNVYGIEGSKMQGIDTYSFSFKVDVSQIPTPMFTRSCTANGSNGEEFQIFLNSQYYSKTDVARLMNGQQLIFLTSGKQESNNEYSYTVRLVTGNPTEVLDNRYTALNSATMYAYNAQPEFSIGAGVKMTTNLEIHDNVMTKIRVEQKYSSDFKATESRYFISDEDFGKASKGSSDYKIYEFNKMEEEVLNQFITSANGFMISGRSTINPNTGRTFLQIENQDLVIGNGLIAQVEEYARRVDYTRGNLSVKHLQAAIDHIVDARGQSVNNHITCICTRSFWKELAKALSTELFIQNPAGLWFYGKDVTMPKDKMTPSTRIDKLKLYDKLPNEISVGATFNSYIYQGNTINFIVEDDLTRFKNNEGYAMFMDTGLYEDEKGKPAPTLNMFTLQGREMVRYTQAGIGGINGTTSGPVSTLIDGSTVGILGWRGIAYRIPYSTVIFQEQF